MARVSDLVSNSGLRKTSRPSVKYDTLFTGQRLDIFVRCTDLTQIDTFSKSDPLCVMFVQRLGQWIEYGRTEAISNNVNPRVSSSLNGNLYLTRCGSGRYYAKTVDGIRSE